MGSFIFFFHPQIVAKLGGFQDLDLLLLKVFIYNARTYLSRTRQLRVIMRKLLSGLMFLVLLGEKKISLVTA